eukprot:GHRR01009633.1.p1 GENE.GHRR01009633.1~~GHRR01009633.1.p1  ORF type:complete len:1069 (+),score=440.49 GHRR01009633.1:481-3207(+)
MTQDAIWLSIAPEIRGRVHVLESADTPEQLQQGLEQRFNVGQALTAVVLELDPKNHSLDLSLRSDRLQRAHDDPAAAAAAGGEQAAAAGAGSMPAGGQLVPGRVVNVAGSGVVVQLGPKLQGIVASTDIHDSWVSNALSGLTAGTYVRARVLAAAGAKPPKGGKALPALVDCKGRVLLSLRPSAGGVVAGKQGGNATAAAAAAEIDSTSSSGLLQLDQLKVGNKVQGYVRSVSTKGLFVVLDRCHDARIKLKQLSDGYVEDPAAAYPVGSRIEGKVLSVEHTKPPQEVSATAAAGFSDSSSRVLQDDGVRVELTLRSGHGLGSSLRTLNEIKEGELTGGKVRRIERYGVFVELNHSLVSGLVHISQVSEGFVKDLAAHYTPGQSVRVRVLSVDRENKKVSLSMKPELLVEDDSDNDSEALGAQVEGLVGSKKRSKQGPAAADFDDEMLDAMDVEADEPQEGSDQGDDESDEGEGGELEKGESEESEQAGGASDIDMDDMDIESNQQGAEGSEGEGGESDSEEDEFEEEKQQSDDDATAAAMPSLLLADTAAAAAGDWGELQLLDGAVAAPEDAATADADAASNGKLSKAQKKRLVAAREAEIRAAEAARRSHSEQPESVTGYEQQLMADPNSSYTWIKYMAFQLKLGEVEAAKRIGERALSTIAMTAEQEKFNVWVALLNLENAYGGANAEEAVMTTFKRGVQYCEPKALYLALLGILERSGRWQLAADVWKTATKRFSTSCKVWLGAFESALQVGRRAAAEPNVDAHTKNSNNQAAVPAAVGPDPRQVLERALKSMPKHKHIKALTRAALAEFRVGNAERGRSILEGVLANYPKRLDIWNVYIDQEIKTGDAARIRALLARGTSLSLPLKKMKVLFRRWLEFEQTHGSAADVAAVKQRAMEYMESQV